MDGEGDHYKEAAEEGKVEAEEDAWTWGAWGAWGARGAWGGRPHHTRAAA